MRRFLPVTSHKSLVTSLQPLVAFLFLFSLTLCAQDFFAHRDQILDNSWKKFGPIYLTPRLLIRNAGYSDNIYQYADYRQGDWTMNLGLQLQADLLVGQRLILSYQILPEYHLYAKASELSNWTVGHTLGLHTYLGHFDLRLSGHTRHSWGNPNPEYGMAVRYQSRGGQAELAIGNLSHFNLLLTADYNENEFEDLRYLDQYNLSLFDHRLQGGGLAVGLRVFTRTQLRLSFHHQDLHYRNSVDLDARIDQLGLSLSLPEIGSLRGNLSLGVQRYTPDSNAFSRLDTPYGSGNLIFQPGRRWRLLLGYQIRVQDSFNQVQQLFVQNSWNLGLDCYLAKRWRIGYRFTDNNLQYRLRSDADTVLFRDRFQLHGASLAFRLFEKTAVGLSWNRMHTVESGAQRRRDYSFIGGYLETDF